MAKRNHQANRELNERRAIVREVMPDAEQLVLIRLEQLRLRFCPDFQPRAGVDVPINETREEQRFWTYHTIGNILDATVKALETADPAKVTSAPEETAA